MIESAWIIGLPLISLLNWRMRWTLKGWARRKNQSCRARSQTPSHFTLKMWHKNIRNWKHVFRLCLHISGVHSRSPINHLRFLRMTHQSPGWCVNNLDMLRSCDRQIANDPESRFEERHCRIHVVAMPQTYGVGVLCLFFNFAKRIGMKYFEDGRKKKESLIIFL